MNKLPEEINGLKVRINAYQQAAMALEDMIDQLGPEYVSDCLHEICVTRLAQETNGLRKLTTAKRAAFNAVVNQ